MLTTDKSSKISSPFGDRSHPITGKASKHKGIDIKTKKGADIVAPLPGTVVHSGQVDGFGPSTIIVDNGPVGQGGQNLYTIYGHNDSSNVSVGDLIKQGTSIGKVGSKGRSTGPHLHLETRLAPAGLKGREIFQKGISQAIDPSDIFKELK